MKNKDRTILYLLIMLICTYMVMIGIFLNHHAITENACKMPVNSCSHIDSESHKSYYLYDKVKYKLFTDYFYFDIPKTKYTYYFSVGDFFVYSGLILMILLTILYFYTNILLDSDNKINKNVITQ